MIRFVCSCGKHLRARDDMAAMRTVCPGCGKLVGVPSTKPTQRGTEAEPLSLTENRNINFNPAYVPVLIEETIGSESLPSPPATPATIQEEEPLSYRVVKVEETKSPPKKKRRRLKDLVDPYAVRQFKKKTSRPRRERTVENAEILFDALRLAFLLSIGGTCFGVTVITSEWAEQGMALWAWLLVGLIPVATMCAICGFWHWSLAFSFQHKKDVMRLLGDLSTAFIRGFLRSVVCFLTGPALLIGVALWFWLNSGEFLGVDRLIFLELVLAAFVYWLFVIVAATSENRRFVASPADIGRLCRRIGYGNAGVTATLMVLLTPLHLGWAWFAMTIVSSTALGWFLFFCCCLSAQFWLFVILRWLGLVIFRNEKARTAHASALSPITD